jgi:hypothetical protein
MKRLRVYRVDFPDGEIHLILDKPKTSEHSECFADVAEIKRISRREAVKPLLLFREE